MSGLAAQRLEQPPLRGGQPDLLVLHRRAALDFAERRATVDEQEIRLTPTEWRLLEALCREPGHLVLQQDLLRSVWGPSYGRESNYLRVYANQLRRKLEPDPSAPRHLITEPGLGYRFTP